MAGKNISLTGAAVGGLAGWVVEVVFQEVTGHHITTGLLEVVGAAAGLWRLDKRMANYLQDTLVQARKGGDDDYREVKRRIEELTQDLPELRDILRNMVDAGSIPESASGPARKVRPKRTKRLSPSISYPLIFRYSEL